jgi:hypothetical protein
MGDLAKAVWVAVLGALAAVVVALLLLTLWKPL